MCGLLFVVAADYFVNHVNALASEDASAVYTVLQAATSFDALQSSLSSQVPASGDSISVVALLVRNAFPAGPIAGAQVTFTLTEEQNRAFPQTCKLSFFCARS